jgi:uncharacterized SAM-binding protein YcdF (DUF218 family)
VFGSLAGVSAGSVSVGTLTAGGVGGGPGAAPVDAVLVCAGGRGERLRRALALMDAGTAPLLVVPHGRNPDWPEARALLGRTGRHALVCPTPVPSTTRGEAHVFRDLAVEHGWRRVVLVTSTYHARRAALLVRRCLPPDVALTVDAARPRIGPLKWVRVLAHEAGGLVVAALRRRC